MEVLGGFLNARLSSGTRGEGGKTRFGEAQGSPPAVAVLLRNGGGVWEPAGPVRTPGSGQSELPVGDRSVCWALGGRSSPVVTSPYPRLWVVRAPWQ